MASVEQPQKTRSALSCLAGRAPEGVALAVLSFRMAASAELGGFALPARSLVANGPPTARLRIRRLSAQAVRRRCRGASVYRVH